MISKRLYEVMNVVKPDVEIPIIIEVVDEIKPEYLQQINNLVNVKYVSKILPLIYGKATYNSINMLDELPFVKEISYDEPIYNM